MRSQSETIYDILKEKIVKGDYYPSEPLTEMDLSKQYNVSRNTVKKALLMLEKENLVTIEQNKGARVSSHSKDEILEFLELRSVLEGFIVSKSIETFDEKGIDELKILLDTMKEHIANKDLLAYSKCNHRFHVAIYEACSNKTAVEMTIQLKNRMSKYNTKTILIPARDQQSFKEHTMIYEAIKAGNKKKAEDVMKTHIFNVRTVFSEYYSLLF